MQGVYMYENNTVLFMLQPVLRIRKFEFLIISKDPDSGGKIITDPGGSGSITLVKTQNCPILMSDTLQTILHTVGAESLCRCR